MTSPFGGDEAAAQLGQEVHVKLPTEPPALTPGAARALLRLLLAESQQASAEGPPKTVCPAPAENDVHDRRKLR